MIPYVAIGTMEDEEDLELLCSLSNGAIFSDIEWPLIHIPRTRDYLTLNISEMVPDINILTMKY